MVAYGKQWESKYQSDAHWLATRDALALVGQATFDETFSGILDGAAIVGPCRQAHSYDDHVMGLALSTQ